MNHLLCDLDGVIWLAHRPIAGSVAAIERLQSAGIEVLFVTNNSVATVAQHEAALAQIGIDANGAVTSSAQAAALLVKADEIVMVVGGPGIVEAVNGRGATAVDWRFNGPAPDALIVGLDRTFDYPKMTAANRAVRAGARLIATNDDPTYPTPDGPQPGGGAIVAAVATAAGVTPTIAGKPHRPMADLVIEHIGPSFDPDQTLMVGDRKSTDGRFAAAIGCRFALVRSGVDDDTSTDVAPAFDAASLSAMVDELL